MNERKAISFPAWTIAMAGGASFWGQRGRGPARTALQASSARYFRSGENTWDYAKENAGGGEISRLRPGDGEAGFEADGAGGEGDVDAGVLVVEEREAAAEVGEAGAGGGGVGVAADPRAGVFDGDDEFAGLDAGVDGEAEGNGRGDEAVLEGVFDEGEEEGGRGRDGAGFLGGVELPIEAVGAEAGLFDAEVAGDGVDLAAKGRVVGADALVEGVAEVVGEGLGRGEDGGGVGGGGRGGDGVERAQEKLGAELGAEELEFDLAVGAGDLDEAFGGGAVFHFLAEAEVERGPHAVEGEAQDGGAELGHLGDGRGGDDVTDGLGDRDVERGGAQAGEDDDGDVRREFEPAGGPAAVELPESEREDEAERGAENAEDEDVR